MDNLEKNILITGGCSGIGRELVKFFLEKNYKIAIFDKNIKCNEKENIEGIKFFYCDVSDDLSVDKACQKLFKDYFYPDVLINNAGIIHNEPLVNVIKKDNRLHSRESWEKVISTDLSSVFYVSSRIVDQMISNRKNVSRLTTIPLDSGWNP